VVNRDFSDPIPNDGQGGWTDEGPEWDLRFFPVNRTGIDRHGMPCPKEEFPTRPLRLGRCEFAIINPETNGGKACLVLGRKKGLPSESGRIPVNRTAAALWFLHADDIGWNAADPVPVAAFTVYYRDGSTRDGEMINFNHVGDWRCPDSTFRSGDGYVAWHGYCKAHEPVALYAFQWRNPTPEKPMESITIRVKGNPAYMLVALTAEQ